MGFGTPKDSQRTTYVSIIGANLTVKAKEGDIGAVSRVNKNDITVWEMLYPDLTGALKSVKCVRNEHLKAFEYVVLIDDLGTEYRLSIPCDSKYGDSFASKLRNLKIGDIYTFKPYSFEDKVKKNAKGEPMKVIGISITKNGEKIPFFYTEENPNGRPIPEKEMSESKYKIYQINLRDFYKEEVEKFNSLNKPADQPKEQISQKDTQEFDDDLGF